MTTRTGFIKKHPPFGKPTRLCAVDPCRKSGPAGGLCAAHQLDVAGDVAADLTDAGILVSAGEIRVAVNEGLYLNFTDDRLKPVAFKPVHRAVMQAKLGRPFLAGENVHHVNGCKWDNSVDNLELWVTSQPPGQRPQDLAAYARALLSRYGTTEETERYRAR